MGRDRSNDGCTSLPYAGDIVSALSLWYKWALKSSCKKYRFAAFCHCLRTAAVLAHANSYPSTLHMLAALRISHPAQLAPYLFHSHTHTHTHHHLLTEISRDIMKRAILADVTKASMLPRQPPLNAASDSSCFTYTDSSAAIYHPRIKFHTHTLFTLFRVHMLVPPWESG